MGVNGGNLAAPESAIIYYSLRSTFELQLSQIVEDSVARVVVDFNKKLVSLETENAELKDRISHLQEQLNQTTNRQDKSDQYSRRNCLRISGITEAESESTDDIVLDMAKAIGANLTL